MTSSLLNDDADSPTQDSGVQLLDSETDLNDSMISSSGLDFEVCDGQKSNETIITASSSSSCVLPDLLAPLVTKNSLSKSDIENNNEQNTQTVDSLAMTSSQAMAAHPDIATSCDVDMISSIHSTFDTENTEIVYRRKIKKQTKSAPKKRVSFHEDILNSTRTDNIHIEHGFITYKGRTQKSNTRYSWCSEYKNEDLEARHKNDDDDDDSGHHVYRNACSEVLDYGKTDIQDDDEKVTAKYDKSGVFEYPPLNAKRFYRCTCSSSSSIESGSSGENNSNDNSSSSISSNDSKKQEETSDSSKCNYKQSKSSSCDCIETSQNGIEIGKGTCYFSEPNIRRSVWNKEKKPKSSCLKKSSKKSMPTDIVQETPQSSIDSSVKKFNIHQLSSSVIKDNGKMIIGSLKDILGISLPERGVPEGSVEEEIVPEASEEISNQSPKQDFAFLHKVGLFLPNAENIQKLSKSLDGGLGKQNKTFVHNVDEQLRRANEEDLFAPSNSNSRKSSLKTESSVEEKEADEDLTSSCGNNPQRNKFIINCESTVFEHTGTVENSHMRHRNNGISDDDENSFVSSPMNYNPFRAKINNIFSSIAGNAPNKFGKNNKNTADVDKKSYDDSEKKKTYREHRGTTIDAVVTVDDDSKNENVMESSVTSTSSDKNSSIISDISSTCSNTTYTSNTTASINQNYCDVKLASNKNSTSNNRNAHGTKSKSSKHISSPMRDLTSNRVSDKVNQARMSPDLFNRDFFFNSNLQSVKNPNAILSDEFEDILTISMDNYNASSSTTTTTGASGFVDDKTLDCGNDIVIVDYSDVKNDLENNPNTSSYYLKLPSIMTSSIASSSSKSSLINRFLRNVTQKKILEASIKRNSFFQAKLKNETKLFGGNLYVKGVKPKNEDMIKNLNAEIDAEVEMGCNSLEYDEEIVSCGSKSNRSSLYSNNDDDDGDIDDGGEVDDANEMMSYDAGIGEIKIDLFRKKNLDIFRDCTEMLMKAFKLYTGYSGEGNMCAVLVFLTDKTIYVVELVRNELCNKFVLPYAELDVILMGPMGNTVLLSNTARDMQQVLLTCGPYPAEKLISSLEMCARRGGFPNLPAVGQLTLDHFAPLQSFVCNNSSVSKSDAWKFYSIVNIPAGILGVEDEPLLGMTLQGFFMHRNLSNAGVVQKWSAAYFMLKAGVLYLFHDSTQRIPSWAVSLPNECQGARRCTSSNRPHCFEILLRSGSLQLAAPDEYVCSEWLQSVVQTASSIFDVTEKPKILGCTLIMTENHLITLREDFSSPLRRVTLQQPIILSPPQSFFTKENIDASLTRKLSSSTILDTSSEVSSIRSTPSTPSRSGCRSNSTVCSTPTRQSKKINYDECHSHTNMTSFYGKNSGIEVLTCAAIEELISIKIPNDAESWWCILV